MLDFYYTLRLSACSGLERGYNMDSKDWYKSRSNYANIDFKIDSIKDLILFPQMLHFQNRCRIRNAHFRTSAKGVRQLSIALPNVPTWLTVGLQGSFVFRWGFGIHLSSDAILRFICSLIRFWDWFVPLGGFGSHLSRRGGSFVVRRDFRIHLCDFGIHLSPDMILGLNRPHKGFGRSFVPPLKVICPPK